MSRNIVIIASVTMRGNSMVNISLQNRVALVTGASRGIGKAIAVSLARAGATVAVGYNTNRAAADETLRQCGGTCLLVKGNVDNPTHCRHIVKKVIRSLGRIDILVNNAGIFEPDSFDMPLKRWIAHWQHTLDTNFMSAVHLSYFSLQHMEKQGGGKIINIASRAAFRGETEYFAYAASKAAMVNFTRCLARTFATRNILAYAVAPGFIQTDMVKEEIKRYGDNIREQIPSGKIGMPEDVANLVLFLASDLCNYMTGSTIDINGGSYLH